MDNVGVAQFTETTVEDVTYSISKPSLMSTTLNLILADADPPEMDELVDLTTALAFVKKVSSQSTP
jgi:hypothetical protein